ncbi:YueI family protein [Peribacillus cavernae]|uniref:YueI family protein n=1 Tax=Peribacillus cavernae TaxID=1674310 RepID=UPI001FECDE20|nr:YueI family protein [Peribacillus cavernae]
MTIDDYLQEGIHGKKVLKPEERKKYLGTLRERVVVVLTRAQVREATTYPEIARLLKENYKATLLLNGAMNYSDLAKYIALASKIKAPYKIIASPEHTSELGLVLASDTAVDKDTITIDQRPKQKAEKRKRPGFVSRFINKLKKKRN